MVINPNIDIDDNNYFSEDSGGPIDDQNSYDRLENILYKLDSTESNNSEDHQRNAVIVQTDLDFASKESNNDDMVQIKRHAMVCHTKDPNPGHGPKHNDDLFLENLAKDINHAKLSWNSSLEHVNDHANMTNDDDPTNLDQNQANEDRRNSSGEKSLIKRQFGELSPLNTPPKCFEADPEPKEKKLKTS